MNLQQQREYILTGKMYNDLTPELVKAREDTVILTAVGSPCRVLRAITDADKTGFNPNVNV